jgi:hypothetical protein
LTQTIVIGITTHTAGNAAATESEKKEKINAQ